MGTDAIWEGGTLPLQLRCTQRDNVTFNYFLFTICFQEMTQYMAPTRLFCHDSGPANKTVYLASIQACLPPSTVVLQPVDDSMQQLYLFTATGKTRQRHSLLQRRVDKK